VASITDHCNHLISQNIGSAHLCLETRGECSIMQRPAVQSTLRRLSQLAPEPETVKYYQHRDGCK